MGRVKEERAKKILEDALMGYLLEDYLPTTGELQVAYDAEKKAHGDLARSKIRRVTPPARWSEASASNMNAIIGGVESDMHVLLRALVSTTETSLSYLNEWNARALSLESKLAKVRARIESLLLLKSDAAGYLAFVEDGFMSLENVSGDTTAIIDTNAGEASLSVNRSEAEGSVGGTLIDLQDASVTWELINRNKVRYSVETAGQRLKSILEDSITAWSSRVKTTDSSLPVVGELKVFLAALTEISKATLITPDSGLGGPLTVALQYSEDGYSWISPVTESHTQSGRGNFIFHFEKVAARYIKFIISKSAPDQRYPEPTYDFAVKQVKLYSESYSVTTDPALVVSEVLTPQLAGEDIPFGRASLEVCDEVPNEAVINYYLRAYDGTSYTNWVKVIPINRKSLPSGLTVITSGQGPAIVDFAAPENLDSSTLATSFDSSKDTEALNLDRIDGSSDLAYRFRGPNEAIANFYIPAAQDLLGDLVFARNIGYSAGKFPTVEADLLVDDMQCGWGSVGDGLPFCAFWVKRPEGTVFHFGDTVAEIDGRMVSGSTQVSPGWHTFRTNKANWASLTGTVPTTASELQALDSLYPYNHKYIIEGYNYPVEFQGNRLYKGADLIARYCSAIQQATTRSIAVATRIGTFDLLTSGLDLSTFALDELETNKTILLVKVDSSRPTYENERVRLFYTRRYESFSGVQFKAELNTKDASKTPVLSYYRIRVR